jgi:hypothetical protein
MNLIDLLITILVLLLLFLIGYTKIQNQRITDTINELKEIIRGSNPIKK